MTGDPDHDYRVGAVATPPTHTGSASVRSDERPWRDWTATDFRVQALDWAIRNTVPTGVNDTAAVAFVIAKAEAFRKYLAGETPSGEPELPLRQPVRVYGGRKPGPDSEVAADTEHE